ncbi:MAG: hypothetical protein FWD81_03945, partial [Methanomassiliicoccaceae archaeon]|nr:hypothetical protein [Methanomassiliicoccaceae archaeon]
DTGRTITLNNAANTVTLNYFTVDLFVTSDDGGLFEYMLNGDGAWNVLDDTLVLLEGTVLQIRATPDIEGSTASWTYMGIITRDIETESEKLQIQLVTLSEPMEVSVEFHHATESDIGLWWVVLLIAAHLTFIIIMLGRYTFITGIVVYKGKGVAGVKVSFTVRGKTKELVTDRNGRYSVSVLKGSDVVMISAVMSGQSVKEVLKDGEKVPEGLPLELNVGKHKTVIDIIE